MIPLTLRVLVIPLRFSGQKVKIMLYRKKTKPGGKTVEYSLIAQTSNGVFKKKADPPLASLLYQMVLLLI